MFFLKVDMPILTCTFFTFNSLTLTSEMHFMKFHPEVASCLLSRGKRKYAPLGMRLLWKYIRNYFLVYHLILHFLLYLQNYKEFEAVEILDLQSEKYGLSFEIKKSTTSCWALGDENVIGIRAFKHLKTINKSCSYQLHVLLQLNPSSPKGGCNNPPNSSSRCSKTRGKTQFILSPCFSKNILNLPPPPLGVG